MKTIELNLAKCIGSFLDWENLIKTISLADKDIPKKSTVYLKDAKIKSKGKQFILKIELDYDKT